MMSLIWIAREQEPHATKRIAMKKNGNGPKRRSGYSLCSPGLNIRSSVLQSYGIEGLSQAAHVESSGANRVPNDSCQKERLFYSLKVSTEGTAEWMKRCAGREISDFNQPIVEDGMR